MKYVTLYLALFRCVNLDGWYFSHMISYENTQGSCIPAQSCDFSALVLRGNINPFWLPTTFLIQLPDYYKTLATTVTKENTIWEQVFQCFIHDKDAFFQRNRKSKQSSTSSSWLVGGGMLSRSATLLTPKKRKCSSFHYGASAGMFEGYSCLLGLPVRMQREAF